MDYTFLKCIRRRCCSQYYFRVDLCGRASSRYNGHDDTNSVIVVQMLFVQRRTGIVLWLAVSKIRNWLCNDCSWICSFDFGSADGRIFLNNSDRVQQRPPGCVIRLHHRVFLGRYKGHQKQPLRPSCAGTS